MSTNTTATAEEKKTFVKVWRELEPEQHRYIYHVSERFHATDDEAERLAITKKVAKAVDLSGDMVVDLDAFMREQLEGEGKRKLDEHRRLVGINVRREREKQDLSQTQLSASSGIHQTYISRIEQGEFCSTYKTIAKLADALSVPMHRLDPSFDDMGDRIRRIRQRKRITLSELGNMLSISSVEVEKLECRSTINADLVRRIASALGVCEAEIDFTREGPPLDESST